MANQVIGDTFALYHGDCCEVIKKLPDASMGFSIFSPPFSSVFVYSDSDHDMGNCVNDAEFFTHFDYLIPELLRVTIPGRLCAVHCSDLPMHKYKDGLIGLKDFPGEIIRHFTDAGWVYHSRVCIWKDPVVEMQRTKAQGLLHKQICKDGSKCRQGIADTLLVFRKEGEDCPVSREGLDPKVYKGTNEGQRGPLQTSIDVWQRYASPVWFDINQTRTLNVKIARTDKDERHLCPLQADVIERAIDLWTLPGDVVFTPFLGVGSEAYFAIGMGRKAIGIELKMEYFKQATLNVKQAAQDFSRRLF